MKIKINMQEKKCLHGVPSETVFGINSCDTSARPVRVMSKISIDNIPSN
jgi:hypothetical protein